MKKKILVIDDEEILIKTFTKLLEKSGYEVYAVCHGHDAIAVSQEEDFDLVISDMRIPGMSGVDIIREIRKIGSEKNKLAPVIFVTGYADEDSEKTAKDLLPVAYIHKPFDMQKLLEAIKKAI